MNITSASYPLMKTMDYRILLLTSATILSGLIAGLMFAFSYAVNPGLAALEDLSYLRAMQSINKAILNPAFLSAFLLPMLLMPLTAYVFRSNLYDVFALIVLAACVYISGVLGITIFLNVPLKESLDSLSLNDLSAYELTQIRNEFQLPWNHYHRLRTIASIVSFGLLIISGVMVKKGAPA